MTSPAVARPDLPTARTARRPEQHHGTPRTARIRDRGAASSASRRTVAGAVRAPRAVRTPPPGMRPRRYRPTLAPHASRAPP
ncbi:hypothetical protein SLNHY_6045 [Streptomyces albus]|nr:hypothetical protein SLNHY_6045 [Streptomyces albus]